MKEIVYITEDKSIEVKLVYISKRRYKNYRHIGKCWPIHTQCLLYYNGLLESFGTVIKHNVDEHDSFYAYREATKKALEASTLSIKWIRSEIWKLFHQYHKKVN